MAAVTDSSVAPASVPTGTEAPASPPEGAAAGAQSKAAETAARTAADATTPQTTTTTPTADGVEKRARAVEAEAPKLSPLTPETARRLTGPVQAGPTRATGELFAPFEPPPTLPPDPSKPGYFEDIARGLPFEPVFGKGENVLTRLLNKAGNSLADKAAEAGVKKLHDTMGPTWTIPLTPALVAGFTAQGRKLREDQIPVGDPRQLGIRELRNEHKGALPVWIEGNFGQTLAFNLTHVVPLGTTGVSATFGMVGAENIGFTTQRLVFVPTQGKDLKESGKHLARLALDPTRGASVLEMESGASYRFFGKASFRVDSSMGIGTSVPALSSVLNIGANVTLGSTTALSGEFAIEMQKVDAGKARLRLTALGNASESVQLQAQVGVTADIVEIKRLMRGFVDYMATGGDPSVFAAQLPNETERELTSSMSGYLRLLAKNIASGAVTYVLDDLVKQYASAYIRARGGIELAANFTCAIDFDFASDALVELPRADMVPEGMRQGVAADSPVRVRVGAVTQLAYDLAMRGDLRLAQQLSQLRSSGVRISERTTTTSSSRTAELAIGLPFLEFRSTATARSSTTDRYTPELGRTRTALVAFNREYRGLFGGSEDSSAEVRVHAPDGKTGEQVFFGSDVNFSADLVVQNKSEKRTDFEEMQDLVGVLNVISGGRLEERTREALATGEFRHDTWRDDINPIHQIFAKPNEYGRTIAHLHVWLGEAGLRHLLESNQSQDELYAAIGRVFAKLEPEGTGKLPAWALPGADRGAAPDLLPSDGSVINYGTRPMDHDLPTARYLVDNLLRLRDGVRSAKTPAQEEVAAGKIRAFLRDAKDKLPAYAALASLVPEQERAVEMRLTAMRSGKAPIRFTYIQDGRASDILYATGLARMGMQQFTRYSAVLDGETRLRVGNIFGDIYAVLNSPSPDMYRLEVAQRALENELAAMDQYAAKMSLRIAEDLGFARACLDALPPVSMLQSALPGPLGTELATLRLEAQRLLDAPTPDLTALRKAWTALLAKQSLYRQVQAASPLLQSTGSLANSLAPSAPELGVAARAAVDAWRAAVSTGASPEVIEATVAAMITTHGRLLAAADQSAGGAGDIAVEKPAVATPPEATPAATATPAAAATTPALDPRIERPNADELVNARTDWAKRYRSLAGNPAVAPVSYFERTGVVPPYAAGVPFESGGEGIVTASMVREADLAMAASQQSPMLPSPPLPAESVTRLVDLVRKKDVKGVLAAATELTWKPADLLPDKRKRALELMLADLPAKDRGAFLARLPVERRIRVQRIFNDFDTLNVDGRLTDGYRTEKARYFADNPGLADERRFIENILVNDPSSLDTALTSLGYGRTIDEWYSREVVRLDSALKQVSGDELDALVGKMSDAERAQFYGLIKKSDLTPQTRARLAGHIVDDSFFFLQEEKLVEALVTGMNARDLRIFFDELQVDGKLENFLSHRTFWETLVIIFTFGIARLFFHNNDAALRVCAAQGWRLTELEAEYNAKSNTELIERKAETIMTNAVLDTTPIDPMVRGGLRVVHSLIGNVKYYDLKDMPTEALDMLKDMARGAGKQLTDRLSDISKKGGSVKDMANEYVAFLKGLSPSAIRTQFNTSDTDGSVALIAKALGDGAIAGLIASASDPNNKFLRLELIGQVVNATNTFDSPIRFVPGKPDPRMDTQDYNEMVEKAAFFTQFTGFDFSQVELLRGGTAMGGVPAMSFANTISVNTAYAPIVNGKMQIDDWMQQVIAFHETVHTMQSMMYGIRANSPLDQGMAVIGGGSRNGAYLVDDARLDATKSVHDLADHWEQQAELIEATLRVMWANTRKGVAADALPAGVATLDVGGGIVHLTPERWQKMVGFVRELGTSARNSLALTGGKFVIKPYQKPI